MLKNMITVTILAAMSVGLTACAEATSTSPCGEGESVQVNGASYCVYKEAIVIVGGFDCPASMRFRMDFERATVCGDHAFDNIDVPNDICARAFVPCTEIEHADAGLPLQCDQGFGDCDADPSNGCEAPLDRLDNCGTCGVTCSGENASCASGTCTTGPLLPSRRDCSGGVVYASVAECEATTLTCYALPAGETCGVCTSTEIDCTRVDCADYVPLIAPPIECVEGIGAWEGTCGSVRYRSEQGGYGGPVRYWDRATGDLLAARLSSDVGQYCDASFSVEQGDLAVIAGCDVVQDESTSLCAR